MNAHIDYTKFILAPSFPVLTVDQDHAIEIKDGFAHFYLEIGSEYIEVRVKTASRYESYYKDVAVDNDPQNNVYAGHQLIEASGSLVEVVDISDTFIKTEIGQVIQLTEQQVSDLSDHFDSYNELTFEKDLESQRVEWMEG